MCWRWARCRSRRCTPPATPPACLTYRIGDAAFVGDTLFMPDYGTARADFPGGDARTLYRSIQKVLALPPETRVFVGHDYLPAGRDTFRWETTVAERSARATSMSAAAPRRTTSWPCARPATPPWPPRP